MEALCSFVSLALLRKAPLLGSELRQEVPIVREKLILLLGLELLLYEVCEGLLLLFYLV